MIKGCFSSRAVRSIVSQSPVVTDNFPTAVKNVTRRVMTIVGGAGNHRCVNFAELFVTLYRRRDCAMLYYNIYIFGFHAQEDRLRGTFGRK